MQRRDYVLLSLCTPFMTVWMAKWRSVNNKWKEETTIFNVCSCFCFLGCCCCCCLSYPQISVGIAKRATFPNNIICKEKIIIFHFFLFAHSANVFWNGQVTFLINEMQRGDCRLVFVCLFFFAYPRKRMFKCQVTFSYNICKKEIIVSLFLFCFCFFMGTSQLSTEMAKWIFLKNIGAKKRSSSFSFVYFIAYPADLCWDGKLTF